MTVNPSPKPANRWEHHGPEADPWSAMSSVMAGVLLWGLIGWGVATWLHSKAWIGAGLIIGGVLGVWIVYLRYGRSQSGPPETAGPVVLPGQVPSTGQAHNPATPPSAMLLADPTTHAKKEDTT